MGGKQRHSAILVDLQAFSLCTFSHSPTVFIHSGALLYIFNTLKCLFLRKSALLAKFVGFSCKMFVFAENALIFAPDKPALCALKVRVLDSVERVLRECFARPARFCACLLLKMCNI